MKKMMFACATILFALILTAGAFVPSQKYTAVVNAHTPQKDVPVNITDKNGRPIKVESLPRETQAQVERVKVAMRSLLDSGSNGAQKVTITVRCSYPPMSCEIVVRF